MKDITIYSTTTCGYCHMLKAYLKSKNIAYTEKIADHDPKLAEELFNKSGQLGVPFTIFTKEDGEEINVLGFDRPQIDRLLNL